MEHYLKADLEKLDVAFRRYVKLRALVVRDAPANATVRVRCRGRGCPFARKRLRDTAVDRISGRTSDERHQQQTEHRGIILSK